MERGSSDAGRRGSASVTRRRRIVGAAVLAMALWQPSGAAAAQPRVLVVDGARSASVDVTFTRSVTVDLPRAVVSGGGRFAGFYFQPLAGSPSNGAGALYVRAYATPGVPAMPIPLGTGARELEDKPVLAPGRYRVHVLGDKAVRVSVRVSGHPGGRLRATRVTRAAYSSRDVTPYPAGVAAPGGSVATLPIDVVSARAISLATIQLVHHGSAVATQYTAQLCIGASARPPCPAEDSGTAREQYHQSHYTVTMPTMTLSGTDEWARFYHPDKARLSAGPHTAHFALAATSLVDRVTVAALSFAV